MMRLVGRFLLLSLVMSIAIGAQAATPAPEQSDATLRTQLQRVASLRIYLGHQSVGANLLDGLKQLASKSDVPLHVVENNSAQAVPAATFAHTFVGENRNPLGKLQAFDKAMGPQSAGVDIAMLKFCFLDFEPDTNVQALFARYQDTMRRVRERNPKLTIVHITTPLTTVQTGPKAFLKNLLGKPPYGVLENQRREEYNALLRSTYAGKEPIFDLARVESTAADGSATTHSWNGSTTAALTAAYTNDGAHLNTQGQLVAARQLAAVLANAATH